MLKCKNCGAPMRTWRECDYCGTRYDRELDRMDRQDLTFTSTSQAYFVREIPWYVREP